MTDNNSRDANDANADKSENIVHIAKDGAEELQKIKRSLNSKKTWVTRDLDKLDKRAKAFKDSAAKYNTDKTPAQRVHLQKKAEEVLVLVTESKLKKHHEELEKLAEEVKETLDQYPVTGANGEEVTSKIETEAFDYIDRIENALNDNDVLIAEAVVASKPEVTSTPAQRNVSAPAAQTQQGDVFRDVGSLKPSYLEKGSNLMEVSHWIEQAQNYIEAGYRDAPPDEGTYK